MNPRLFLSNTNPEKCLLYIIKITNDLYLSKKWILLDDSDAESYLLLFLRDNSCHQFLLIHMRFFVIIELKSLKKYILKKDKTFSFDKSQSQNLCLK